MTKSITWQTEKRKLSDLLPWERNPRQLSKVQAEHLEESLSKFGLVDPPAINTDNVIIGGHQRRNIMGLMKEYGNGAEIDVRVPSRTLADREVEELNIRLNKNTGSFDFDALANNFEVDDLLDWGFEPFELGIEDETDDTDAEPQLDRAEELREKWGVELGQLWQLGEHRLICGDCTDAGVVERLMDGEMAVAVVTDPPYGIGASEMTMGSAQSSMPKESRLSHEQAWDGERGEILWLLGVFDWVCIWGGNYFADILPVTNDWLCWHKNNDNLSFSEFELAWTNYKKRSRHITHHWGAERKRHITQKPLPVLEWSIEICPDESGTVFDPFLGSGTTLIACENLNRKCYGVEIEPKYVAVTLQRYYDAFGIEPELIG